MPDIYLDVDVALAEVPVNILPLLDDTDFKTRETAVAYNAAGMDLVWNFVTSAGAYTQTAVTPTTSGDYDWAHQGDGMYSIEIPASGGASINNDTEGYGWFSGLATGVLPWRGPIIAFRAANTNDLMVDGTFSWDKFVLPAGAIPALGIVENGTLQSATASTAVLRSATSIADDLINNVQLEITGGTGAGQQRVVTDWVSATDTATVSPNWTTTPDNTSTYIVRAMAPAPTALASLPPVDVRGWLGTAPATPTVAGVPEVDLTHVAGSTTDVSALATSVAAILVDTGTTLDAFIQAVKTKTDQLTFTTANMVDSAVKRVGDTTLNAAGTGGQGYGA